MVFGVEEEVVVEVNNDHQIWHLRMVFGVEEEVVGNDYWFY